MICTCNSFQSDIVGIFTDFTRNLAEPVVFPPPKEPDQKYIVVPTNVNPLWPEVTGKNADMRDSEVIIGTNYVWISQTLFITVLSIAGSLVARKLDKTDEQTQSIGRTSPIPVAKQNHFINEVANELKEPYA